MAAGRESTRVLWRQLLALDARSPVPLHAQLRARLIAAIEAGRLASTESLPSSRALAEQLGVSRNTVVHVYQQLADEGVLVARHRLGYFPLDRPAPARAPTPGRAGDDAASAAVASLARRHPLPSRQRRITKVPDWERYDHPFIYGQLDTGLFPATEWRSACQLALGGAAAQDWAQDRIERDDPLLIEQIRDKVLPLRGIWAADDEILVTIGAQQALYLIADLLVDAGTEVGFEDPGYPDARNILSRRTGRIRPLALDEQGLIPGAALSGCGLVYTTPSHQSPTTVTMPLARRVELLRQADADDFLLIEDDYETEVSFSGLPNPALKSLDRSGRVIYVGSLSKSFAPGLRLGYVVAPAPLIAELRALRRLMIRHAPAFVERAFAQFLAMGHYLAFQRRLASAYRERAQVLAESLARHIPDARHPPVNGGSSFWVEGPSWLDTRRLAEEARSEQVLIEPGDVHFASDTPPLRFFRLGFASIPPAAIREGIRRLGRLVERQRPASR